MSRIPFDKMKEWAKAGTESDFADPWPENIVRDLARDLIEAHDWINGICMRRDLEGGPYIRLDRASYELGQGLLTDGVDWREADARAKKFRDAAFATLMRRTP